ncbi:MAG: beta-propeller fold lactonase family protein [Planctomycetota bacterium]
MIFKSLLAALPIQLIGCVLGLCAMGLCGQASANHPSDSFRIIAADKSGQKILSLRVTRPKGQVKIEQERSIPVDFAPSSIAYEPKRGMVYAIGSGDLGKSQSTFASIATEFGESKRPSEGLRIVGQVSHPIRPGYSSVDRTGQYLLTSNYQTGEVSVLAIRDDGLIGNITYQTTTPKPEAHCILTTPDNRFAYVPSVKENNALAQYSFDATSGTLAPLTPLDAIPPAMFGPRHVAYHPSLPIAYFSNEQQLGISVYEIAKGGQLIDRQHASSMPRRDPYVKGLRGLHASDLVFSPTVGFVFLAVRDFVGDEDSVFTYRVKNDGRLGLLDRTRVGDIPWKLDLSPNGKMLCVSETFDNRLSIYHVGNKGELSFAASCDWDTSVRDMVILPSAD